MNFTDEELVTLSWLLERVLEWSGYDERQDHGLARLAELREEGIDGEKRRRVQKLWLRFMHARDVRARSVKK